jgi:hypothetical protein
LLKWFFFSLWLFLFLFSPFSCIFEILLYHFLPDTLLLSCLSFFLLFYFLEFFLLLHLFARIFYFFLLMGRQFHFLISFRLFQGHLFKALGTLWPRAFFHCWLRFFLLLEFFRLLFWLWLGFNNNLRSRFNFFLGLSLLHSFLLAFGWLFFGLRFLFNYRRLRLRINFCFRRFRFDFNFFLRVNFWFFWAFSGSCRRSISIKSKGAVFFWMSRLYKRWFDCRLFFLTSDFEIIFVIAQLSLRAILLKLCIGGIWFLLDSAVSGHFSVAHVVWILQQRDRRNCVCWQNLVERVFSHCF